ncbi:thioredoxin family protein [Robertkochia sediminum]|uniref:thioredoxin family protein n=1 Tax=Robertkochia sediminum TaxID=2785326 RepID=UPI0019340301|nr:thioredoxin family protein [Robertkochia sediminum]MBL7472363.1 thioredoxin family protein [Robertkochia sediminum]
MILKTSKILAPDLLQTVLKEAMPYEEFRKEVFQLLETNRVTGKEQSDAYLHYTLMNEKRMDRWEKTFRIPEGVAEAVSAFTGKVTWLVITEGWCGDGAHALPVMKKLADLNENITLKMVIRDEHPELMDEFLTNGARSIPKLLMLDEATGMVSATWGPRPSEAARMVEDEKREKGELSPQFRADLQMWYNRDKGKNIAADLADLLSLELVGDGA